MYHGLLGKLSDSLEYWLPDEEQAMAQVHQQLREGYWKIRERKWDTEQQSDARDHSSGEEDV